IDIFSINGNDEIAANHDGNISQISTLSTASQTGMISGPAGYHALNEDAIIRGQPKLLSQLGSDGQRLNAKNGAPHPAGCNQIIEHGFGGIDRNGKAYAGALLSSSSQNQRINADYLSARVE